MPDEPVHNFVHNPRTVRQVLEAFEAWEAGEAYRRAMAALYFPAPPGPIRHRREYPSSFNANPEGNR